MASLLSPRPVSASLARTASLLTTALLVTAFASPALACGGGDKRSGRCSGSPGAGSDATPAGVVVLLGLMLGLWVDRRRT